MRSIRSVAAEFAVIVGVVAVGTENPCVDGSALGMPVQIPHEFQQTRLREWTVAVMHYGVARPRRSAELRDNVQWVPASNSPRRQVPEDGGYLLACTSAVTTQADFKLICRWSYNRGTIGSAYPGRAELGTSNGSQRKGSGLFCCMRIVAVNTGGVTILVQYFTLGRAVLVASIGKRMPGFRKLGVDTGNRGRDVGTSVVTVDAVLSGRVHIRDGLSRSIK